MQMILETDNEASVTKIDDYDYTKNAPKSVIVSSADEVRRRVALAEERVANGQYITQDEYEKQMDKFFVEELGTKR